MLAFCEHLEVGEHVESDGGAREGAARVEPNAPRGGRHLSMHMSERKRSVAIGIGEGLG